MKKNQGITLIALVITIIVMLILVAVTITIAVNGGLFDYARSAAADTNTAIEDEQDLANIATGQDYEQLIAKYTGESGSVTNPYSANAWAKAWTYSSSTGKWSGTYNTYQDNMEGDIIAKAYTIDGGYHLVIEKIGSSGEMGALKYASATNRKIAQNISSINDSAKIVIAKGGSTQTWHAWKENIKDQILKVSICDGITSIAYGAFMECSNLTDVEMSSTVESINSDAFESCSSLRNIKMPTGLAEIQDCAFARCTNLQEITIPRTVNFLGYSAFYGCTSLTTVIILSNNIEEMRHTFSGCSSLTTISAFPSNLQNMEATFEDCTSLINIPTIPNGVLKMPTTFRGCTSLSTVPDIPTSVTDIYRAFSGCSGLTVIPNIWTRVTTNTTTYKGTPDGQGCFEGCTGASNFGSVPEYWKTVNEDGVEEEIEL